MDCLKAYIFTLCASQDFLHNYLSPWKWVKWVKIITAAYLIFNWLFYDNFTSTHKWQIHCRIFFYRTLNLLSMQMKIISEIQIDLKTHFWFYKLERLHKTGAKVAAVV